ncbi:MAG: hypothetical protein HGGPFJEG_02298 [Ignavibacteria bacterium]|nr:hypothetical protein [Ignavibacteria bacterium]
MKTISLLIFTLLFLTAGCGNEQTKNTSEKQTNKSAGITPTKDEVSQKDVVDIAIGSKDHTTLVTAVKAADLVTSLKNAGPFTVFAPVNAAFDKLPKGTVDDLLKPENKSKLTNILYHHVIVGVMKEDMLQDGSDVTMFDGKTVKISKKDGATYIDDAKIVASVAASNGIVHVIDAVILAK